MIVHPVVNCCVIIFTSQVVAKTTKLPFSCSENTKALLCSLFGQKSHSTKEEPVILEPVSHHEALLVENIETWMVG